MATAKKVKGFVNVTTSGTTGYPQRIAHLFQRHNLKQVVELKYKTTRT